MTVRSSRIKIEYRKLGREKALGYTDSTDVVVDSRLKGKKQLEIILHECLHYLYPEASEEEVITKSVKLTKTLWYEGYRKIDNHDKDPLQDGTL